jgi:hypothetical protein
VSVIHHQLVVICEQYTPHHSYDHTHLLALLFQVVSELPHIQNAMVNEAMSLSGTTTKQEDSDDMRARERLGPSRI